VFSRSIQIPGLFQVFHIFQVAEHPDIQGILIFRDSHGPSEEEVFAEGILISLSNCGWLTLQRKIKHDFIVPSMKTMASLRVR